MKNSIILIAFTLCTNLFSQVQIGSDIDGGEQWGSFGESVSLSSDGSVLAVGAPENNNYFGNVRVYGRSATDEWVQIGEDINGLSSGDDFGWSVDLSSDGSIVAISSPFHDNINGDNSGQVRVFQKQEDNWVQLGQPINGASETDRSGYSISISSDGTILAIGARGNSSKAYLAGHVRIYKYVDNEWEQIGAALEGDKEWDSFGTSVRLSSDGATVIVGATEGANSQGAGYARVFRKNSLGEWDKIGSDITGKASNDSAAQSVDISQDGQVVAIGSLLKGYVSIYKYTSGEWVQLGGDIEEGSSGDFFGDSISLSLDGSIVAIGARNDSSSAGNVRVYTYNSNEWIQLGDDIIGEFESDFSGKRESLSLSSDGKTVAIGASSNDGAEGVLLNSGHVRVFDLEQLVLSTTSEEISDEMIVLYPNPVHDELRVNIKSGYQLRGIKVYNSIGQSLLSTNDIKLNLSDFESGLYYLNIELESGYSITESILVK